MLSLFSSCIQENDCKELIKEQKENVKIDTLPYFTETIDPYISIYEEALPGYNIVGIDCDNSGNNIISLSGAIHCITHSVGVNDPLLISFKQIEDVCVDESPYVSFESLVKHRSGIDEVLFNYFYFNINLCLH